jgi:hypothetical protein
MMPTQTFAYSGAGGIITQLSSAYFPWLEEPAFLQKRPTKEPEHTHPPPTQASNESP